MERKIRRGDMFYADLHPGAGSEQCGYRPIIIVQNNTGNKHSQTVIAALITSKTLSKSKLHTQLPGQGPAGSRPGFFDFTGYARLIRPG